MYWKHFSVTSGSFLAIDFFQPLSRHGHQTVVTKTSIDTVLSAQCKTSLIYEQDKYTKSVILLAKNECIGGIWSCSESTGTSKHEQGASVRERDDDNE